MDKIIKGMLLDNSVNVMAVSGLEMIKVAKSTHELSRVCTAALGRTLLMTAMMGAMLKNETDRVSVIIKGGGPAGSIICTGLSDGTVKGYIENPAIELPLSPVGKLDVASAVGRAGKLTVVRDLSMKEPYVGTCNIISGEIAEDFASYYALSEQQPTLVYLGVRINAGSGDVLSAGGILIQPLPNCPSENIDILQDKAEKIQKMSAMLEANSDLSAVLNDILGDIGFVETERIEPKYRCDCSRARIESVLVSLGEDELSDMIENEHGAEITCHFCNTVYSFGEDELKELLQYAKQKEE